MKNKALCKPMLIWLIAIFYSIDLYGQCLESCCVPVIILRGISYQHGQIYNGISERGSYDGAEIILFYDENSFKHIGYGIKMTFGKKSFDNSTKTIIGGLLEADIHMFEQNTHDDKAYFNPYVGFDFGISEAFLDANQDKVIFTASPIIGFNVNLMSDYIKLNINTKYQLAFEDPLTRIYILSIGIRLNLWDFFKGFGP